MVGFEESIIDEFFDVVGAGWARLADAPPAHCLERRG
jgi:hypothetical protein